MNTTIREGLDDTVARLAPEPAEEREICAELKAAYLEEKILSQRLLALASWTEPGWKPALARQLKVVAEMDEAHVGVVAEILEELRFTPPERPETAHPQGREGMDVRSVLSRGLEAKKDLEIRYVRSASLAEVEGHWGIKDRLEALAGEEAAGRNHLLTVLSRAPAFRPED